MTPEEEEEKLAEEWEEDYKGRFTYNPHESEDRKQWCKTFIRAIYQDGRRSRDAEVEELKKQSILELLRELVHDKDRLEIFRGLPDSFCTSCGSCNPGCYCWHDE